jgi:hypothetical protein
MPSNLQPNIFYPLFFDQPIAWRVFATAVALAVIVLCGITVSMFVRQWWDERRATPALDAADEAVDRARVETAVRLTDYTTRSFRS